MSYDETRMSISSDDYNRGSSVSSSNQPINKGGRSYKKCIFAVVILASLILSILIALDVISIKKILGRDQENKPNLKAQNQVSQENIKEKIKKSKKYNEEEKEIKTPEKPKEDKKDEDEDDDDKKSIKDKKDKDDKEDKEDKDEDDDASDEGEMEMELENEKEPDETDD